MFYFTKLTSKGYTEHIKNILVDVGSVGDPLATPVVQLDTCPLTLTTLPPLVTTLPAHTTLLPHTSYHHTHTDDTHYHHTLLNVHHDTRHTQTQRERQRATEGRHSAHTEASVLAR